MTPKSLNKITNTSVKTASVGKILGKLFVPAASAGTGLAVGGGLASLLKDRAYANAISKTNQDAAETIGGAILGSGAVGAGLGGLAGYGLMKNKSVGARVAGTTIGSILGATLGVVGAAEAGEAMPKL